MKKNFTPIGQPVIPPIATGILLPALGKTDDVAKQSSCAPNIKPLNSSLYRNTEMNSKSGSKCRIIYIM